MNPPCRILFVGEAWGEAEQRRSAQRGRPSPFVSPAGFLLREMLGIVGILPPAPRHYPGVLGMEQEWEEAEKAGIYVTNVFQLRPGAESNDIGLLCGTKKTHEPADLCLSLPALDAGKWLLRKHEGELARLATEITALSPNLIVVLGGTASWALLSTRAISKVRGAIGGTTLTGAASLKVLPTYHPAAILRKSEWLPTVLSDLRKARVEMNDPTHVGRKKRFIAIPETVEDLWTWWAAHGTNASWLSVDIETEAWQWISEVGIAVSPTQALWVPLLLKDGKTLSHAWSLEDEPRVWMFLQEVLQRGSCRVLGQNFIYDVQYLLQRAPVPGGILPRQFAFDTMIAQHAQFPGEPKDLGHLASLYTNERVWKDLRRTSGKSDDASE